MNILEAKEEIRRTVRAYLSKTENGRYRIPVMRQRPIYLSGPPGIGKTQILSQIAGEMDLGLVTYSMTHHTRQSAIGLPRIETVPFDNGPVSVTTYTMSEIIAAVYLQQKETGRREGILFLDEINCVSETLLPAMLQLLQYKSFGPHRLPEGWILVTAGNPPRYNQSARELDAATLDRMKVLPVEPSLSAWQTYAAERRMHPAVLSYLALNPGDFYAVCAGLSGRSFVTARGWEDLSEMLLVLEDLGEEVPDTTFSSYLQHTEIAERFAFFYRLSKNRIAAFGDTPDLGLLSEEPFDTKVGILLFLAEQLSDAARSFASEARRLCSAQNLFAQFFSVSGGEEISTSEARERFTEILKRRDAALAIRRNANLISPAEEEEELSLLKEALAFFDDVVPRIGVPTAATLAPEFQKKKDRCSENETALCARIRVCIDAACALPDDSDAAFLFFCALNRCRDLTRLLAARDPEALAILTERTRLILPR